MDGGMMPSDVGGSAFVRSANTSTAAPVTIQVSIEYSRLDTLLSSGSLSFRTVTWARPREFWRPSSLTRIFLIFLPLPPLPELGLLPLAHFHEWMCVERLFSNALLELRVVLTGHLSRTVG